MRTLAVAQSPADALPLVELRGVSKTYRLGKLEVPALRGISLSLSAGELVAVWGPSGSGKTSLLNLVSLVDVPSSGEVRIAGRRTAGLPDAELSDLRARTVGIVFQAFNLVPVLSALENVMLPLQIRGVRARAARVRAAALLGEVGLDRFAHHRPDRMSGGQRQRVAIARALVGDPILVLADEPTANLDSETAASIVELMRALNATRGVTFLFSTHDDRLLAHVRRRVRLQDGAIAEDRRL
jgi:putative ABC transport system ATP-binding protein